MGTQMPKLEASSMANASLAFHCRPRVNVNDPPAFIIHEVKNAVGHVKKNATAWKIAMKKERPFFRFVWSIWSMALCCGLLELESMTQRYPLVALFCCLGHNMVLESNVRKKNACFHFSHFWSLVKNCQKRNGATCC